MDSNTKPTVKWVLLPMAGLKGEDAPASQTSSSGLDMCGADAMSVNECLYLLDTVLSTAVLCLDEATGRASVASLF